MLGNGAGSGSKSTVWGSVDARRVKTQGAEYVDVVKKTPRRQAPAAAMRRRLASTGSRDHESRCIARGGLTARFYPNLDKVQDLSILATQCP